MDKLTFEQKLLAIQLEVGAIKKDQTNPHFKNTYFDINSLLEVLKPVLNKHKIVLMQPLSGGDMQTILIDTEDGVRYESQVTLPTNPDPQKMGAIITYFRRYSLTSLLALEAEDTDANDTAPVAPVRPSTSKALPPMPAGMQMHMNEDHGVCQQCGEALVYLEWTAKSGSACKAWKCPTGTFGHTCNFL